jgi:hypothetical protein
MGTTINQKGYVENGQFSGGANVLPTTGSLFHSETGSFGFVAGGLYVGNAGTLVARTIDGSVLTFESASGFLPGMFTSFSTASSAGAVVAFR